MDQRRIERGLGTLLVLILLAILYAGTLYFRPTLTGSNRLDGIVGVMLGLLISARVAAHLLDLIYYRSRRLAALHGSIAVIWPTVNLLALLIGTTLIILGAMRFVRAPF